MKEVKASRCVLRLLVFPAWALHRLPLVGSDCDVVIYYKRSFLLLCHLRFLAVSRESPVRTGAGADVSEELAQRATPRAGIVTHATNKEPEAPGQRNSARGVCPTLSPGPACLPSAFARIVAAAAEAARF